MSDQHTAAVGPLVHRHLMTLSLQVDPQGAAQIGPTEKGLRTIVPVVGGRFEGEKLSGKVLGGHDWVLIRGDTMDIDVRLILETDDGLPIYLTYQGHFDGAQGSLALLNQGKSLEEDQYSLAITARFEAGSERYAWLNSLAVVGTGRQSGFNPTYTLYVVG